MVWLPLFVLLLEVGTVARGAHWPQWRGPAFNGSSTEERVPAKFSTTENVRWSVVLPGASAATPAVWDRHVFLPSTDQTNQSLLAMCLDSQTGREVWRREIAPGIKRDDRSNFAAPSPATDGERVWFYYSTGDLVCLDFAGREVWRRNIQKDHGEFAFLWTFSSTPLLWDGRLYLQVLQRDVAVSGRGRKDGPNDSYLLALDPATGKELWRQVRTSAAVAESREAFSSPIPLLGTSRPEVLILGGDCITGHDPATGRELWRWGTWNPDKIPHWRMVTSPAADGGVVLACAPKSEPITAIRTGGNGTLDETSVAWKSQAKEVTADVPTPLSYRQHFYILNGHSRTKILSCVEPGTGRVLWTGALESEAPFEASPTAAAGRIYCVNQRGQVFVVAADPSRFELLHQTPMGQENDRQVRSSIAIAGGRLFIRTDTRLFCIGE